MTRALIFFACVALMGLLAMAAFRYEADRAITFIGLADGTTGFHPGRTVEVAFHRQVPIGTQADLEGPDGPVDVVTWHLPHDPATFLVRSAKPLAWNMPYRLCIQRPRRNFVQQLIGPRQGCLTFQTASQPEATGIPDAAIVVVTGPDALHGAAYGPILSAEGFSDHATIAATDFLEGSLAGRDVILLATRHLSAANLRVLSNWVHDGGLLVAVRPEAAFLSEFGLQAMPAGNIHGGTMTLSRTLSATLGLTPVPLSLHGTIDLFALPASNDDGRQAAVTGVRDPTVHALGLLHDRHGTRLPYPAGILARRGAGAVAVLPFSLAETVVLSRQGNPHWIDQERDGSPPHRPSDLFFPDHVARDRMHVPQADELQRLLANLIVTAAPRPVPRLWYLPDLRRAAVIMTSDDHATPDGTHSLFTQLIGASPEGCRLDRWECLRATSYLSPGTPLDPAEAAHFAAQGFEIGVHIDSGCHDTDDHELQKAIARQMEAFRALYPDLPPQVTARLHCTVWNGWVDVPNFQRAEGIRLDLNYYTWPPNWLQERSGFMTGSGFPMPFMDENGRVLDIYQAATHMINENGVPHLYGVASLLDRALGPEQYFGAFGTHIDFADDYADRVIEAATARGVALISARQMLDWIEARNASSLRATRWDNGRLEFVVNIAPGAERASVLLPDMFHEARLESVSCNGSLLEILHQEIKGITYGAFPAVVGKCEAHFVSLAPPPAQDLR